MERYETATVGGGCFWCTEAVFQRVKGVVKVEPGYAGGEGRPSYEEVCSGTTGHAEVIQITFDPSAVSYRDVLDIFWHTHDPTTLNRQGNDVGTQYRSVVFYHDETQKQIAENMKRELSEQKVWEQPIVTEIVPLKNYYKAEDYHHNYYNSHSYQPYCMFVISPKLEKFTKNFKNKIKSES